MTDKVCIKSMTPAELESFLVALKQPKYRAKQIFKWLSLGATSFSEMSDLPKAFREELDSVAFISHIEIAQKQVSALDGTIKYLFSYEDGNCVETVVMEYEHGISICLSTQAGCKMGCAFCASFDRGETRNLTPGEIYDQVLCAVADSGKKISNIVLMGTGEPLDNYNNVLAFLRIVSHEWGINVGMRHISLSTCGIVPKIIELAQLKLQLTLSVSLHCAIDSVRTQIMPINKKYNVEAVVRACKEYFKITGRRVSYEYAMIAGKTDTDDCGRALVQHLGGMNCHVNLIPLNAVSGSSLVPSPKKRVQEFQNYLLKNKINTTVRRSLGGDIDASCGQLRKKHIKEA